jgi:hypothetical protein
VDTTQATTDTATATATADGRARHRQQPHRGEPMTSDDIREQIAAATHHIDGDASDHANPLTSHAVAMRDLAVKLLARVEYLEAWGNGPNNRERALLAEENLSAALMQCDELAEASHA